MRVHGSHALPSERFQYLEKENKALMRVPTIFWLKKEHAGDESVGKALRTANQGGVTANIMHAWKL
jgi:hypothetical protein